MSEQTGVDNKTEAESPPGNLPKPAAKQESDMERAVYSVITICSLAIVGCFFLPWFRVLWVDISGYQFQQLPHNGNKLVLLIPITALISLVASITRRSVRVAADFAGGMPFLALLYYRMNAGKGAFDTLRPGAYLTLLLGAALLGAAFFLKKNSK